MHIPDGFLNTTTWVPAWAVSLSAIGICLKNAAKGLKEKMVPLMGVVAAFIFAAQMINFPVAGGTSGHLLGGVLAAILLGPSAGAIVIALVLIVQALLFQDGGITVLGANIFNMAIVGTIIGYYIYRLAKKVLKRTLPATFIASWCSVVLASSFCALELALSGTSPVKIVLPAMIGIHAVIGIGEGIITTLIISFILKTRPDLIEGDNQ